jgi:predicted permease
MPQVIFTVLAPIFFVMALGYVAGRMRTIDNHHVGEINALVMDFALPASLFASTGSAPRGEMMAQGPLFAILGAVMLIIYLLWYLFERKALRRSKGEAALQALTVAVPNYAGIGLPIVSTVLGPTATVSVAVALAAGSILVSPFTLMLLELSVGKGQNDAETSAARARRALRHASTTPVVLAPALGILLSLSSRPAAHVRRLPATPNQKQALLLFPKKELQCDDSEYQPLREVPHCASRERRRADRSPAKLMGHRPGSKTTATVYDRAALEAHRRVAPARTAHKDKKS